MSSRANRRKRGNFLADGPIAIWIVILFLFLPLLDFGAIMLRTTFLYMAVHNAARNGAKCRSFLNAVAGESSATQVVANTVSSVMNLWSGVQVNSVLAEIVITDLNTSAVSRQANPLSSPADDSNNSYQLEVTVTGTVDPLVTFYMPWMGNSGIPGLTRPITLTMSDRQFFENTQGLVL